MPYLCILESPYMDGCKEMVMSTQREVHMVRSSMADLVASLLAIKIWRGKNLFSFFALNFSLWT
jgi:hypothetical protein